MVHVTPANVVISAFKRAETGSGYVVRLRETSGQQTTAQLRVPSLPRIGRADRTNGVEVVEAQLPVADGVIPVKLSGWDVATVKVH